jgi:hypothetical protein
MKTLAPESERVDRHFPVERAGDLDATVAEVGRGFGDAPVAARLDELGARPSGELGVPLASPGEQLLPARAELALERRNEGERLGREDLLVARCHELDAARRCDAHGATFAL